MRKFAEFTQNSGFFLCLCPTGLKKLQFMNGGFVIIKIEQLTAIGGKKSQ